jgi:hypothetical protein
MHSFFAAVGLSGTGDYGMVQIRSKDADSTVHLTHVSVVGWTKNESVSICRTIKADYHHGVKYPSVNVTSDKVLRLKFNCSKNESDIMLCKHEVVWEKTQDVAGVFCYKQSCTISFYDFCLNSIACG